MELPLIPPRAATPYPFGLRLSPRLLIFSRRLSRQGFSPSIFAGSQPPPAPVCAPSGPRLRLLRPPCAPPPAPGVRRRLHESGRPETLVARMHRSGVSPNEVTFASVLGACARGRCLRVGAQMHCQVVKSGCEDFAGATKVGEEKEIGKQGLKKMLVREGEGWDRPETGDEVEGYFCPALSKTVKTMKKGEKVLLTVKPQYGFGEQGRPASGVEGAVPPNATLHIDLELVSWKTVTLIGDDKRILKKVLKEGEGYEHPNDGAVVRGG